MVLFLIYKFINSMDRKKPRNTFHISSLFSEMKHFYVGELINPTI